MSKIASINESITSAVMSQLGRRGGKSKSPAKMAAFKRNQKKAWAARRNGHKKAA